jgi:hypothetical protein
MTQGAIDLVQSELGQKSAKTLRLQQAATQNQILPSSVSTPPLALPGTDRTNPPKLLVNEDEVVKITALNSSLEASIGPILAVPGGRPPDLSELRKTVRRQRANGF